MTTTFGLFDSGLIIPTVDDVRTQFEQATRDRFGPNFPLGETGFAGFLLGALTERLSLAYEALQQIRSARDPDAATGSSLRAIGLITSTIAPTALPSTVTLTMAGDDGTTVSQGLIVTTPDTLKQFATADDKTLSLLSPWVTSTSYAVGDRFTNSFRSYQCVSPGISGSLPGPSSQDALITDGTAHHTWIGDGQAVADVDAASVDVGPVVAVARGLTDILSPVFGLNTAINLLDAELGNLDMTDEDFRLFRGADVAVTGTRTGSSLRSKLSELTGVTACTVFQNDTDVVDSDGVPGHSIEVLIQGGDDQEIRDVILANLTLSIGTVGNVVGTSLDDEGKPRTIRHSRPVLVPIYVDVTLTKDPSTYAGDSAVKLAIATFGLLQQAGFDAVASKIQAALFIQGVIDIPRSGSLLGTLIGVAPGPTSDATIVIDTRHLASYATAQVTVHSSDGSL